MVSLSLMSNIIFCEDNKFSVSVTLNYHRNYIFATHLNIPTHKTNLMNLLKKLFLNERFILSVIIINAVIIFAQSYGIEHRWLTALDIICTLIFTAEMVVKHIEYGARGYWADGWNRLDGTLVILSIPSIIAFIFPNVITNLSFLLVLRLLRVLRFFRIMHFFPNFTKIVAGFKLAMRESWGIMLSFLVIIVVVGMLNCSLFHDADPEHFSNPLRSIYSVFQIFTIEGWYDIPNNVAEYYGSYTWIASLIRFYFCILLILGGIIGMSFINSVFVDAMVSDNNDDLEKKIDEVNRKLDEISKKLS